ncbi:Oligoribonuclease, mitochondrial [Pseudozyma hubeiensis]|nr:Oligoribonuclease, mitochondrial [Pseudozyma hubeiensis]
MSSSSSSSPIPPPPATRKLDASDGPLVWIDCEMTGLSVEKGDRLLEVACIVTDGQLNAIDEGVSYVISTDKSVLDNMNEWCINQHSLSGLTSACLSPSQSHPHSLVRTALLAYIRDRIPTPSTACLAGSTVHADKSFLALEMPELISHLHYRIVDVSSIKELVKRWYPQQPTWKGNKEGKGSHRALADIQASIDELKWYREHVFKPQSHTSKAS